MLKIVAVNGNGRATTLRLEGKLVGPWVEELERACAQVLATEAMLTLDLSEVWFVDQAGVDLLRRLRSGRATLSNSSGFVAELLKG